MQLLKPFLGAVGSSFVALQLLFLANMAYLYGTAFNDGTRIHHMKVLFVDYDQDIIGQSVLAAYQQLESRGFPGIHQHPTTTYPSETVIRQAVCKGDYWGAIYTSAGASAQLSTALGSPDAAEAYDSSQALTYVWNGARYAAYAQTISGSLQTLVQATRAAYGEINGTEAMSTVNVSNPHIAKTLFNPISAAVIDIKPTDQGTRFYYNTVSMVMPILMQFFFVMALNSICNEFSIFSTLSVAYNILFRFVLSLLYTFTGALAMTGYIWGFKEEWDLTGNQFGLTWIAIWLVMHLNYLILDATTVAVPTKFMPFVILTWIIVNVSSTLGPFELSPGFYRWGYALPSYELCQVLLDIWTEGCNPVLYRALPVLFSWWIVGLGAFVVGMRRRCIVAVRDGLMAGPTLGKV